MKDIKDDWNKWIHTKIDWDKWVRCPKCLGTRGIEVQTGGIPQYNKAWCPCGWAGKQTELLPRHDENSPDKVRNDP